MSSEKERPVRDERDGMQRFHQGRGCSSSDADQGPSGLDLLVDSGLGDIVLGAVICGALALGVFIFKRSPVVSSAISVGKAKSDPRTASSKIGI